MDEKILPLLLFTVFARGAAEGHARMLRTHPGRAHKVFSINGLERSGRIVVPPYRGRPKRAPDGEYSPHSERSAILAEC